MRQRLKGVSRTNIVAQKYLFERNNREVWLCRLTDDKFQYRLEIAGQGYYMDSLHDVSIFLWGRYGERLPLEKLAI